jgi:hypothetical protein
LAAGGESLGQDTGEKKGDRDRMLHGIGVPKDNKGQGN